MREIVVPGEADIDLEVTVGVDLDAECGQCDCHGPNINAAHDFWQFDGG